jgi:hypothetical protein
MPFSDSNLPSTQSRLFARKVTGARPEWGFVMSIEHPHIEFRAATTADKVLPLRQDNAPSLAANSPPGDDELFAALSPLLEEADGLRRNDSPRQEANDFLRLLEENARLRKLAVRLSNLLGDLPAPESSKSP